MDRGRRSFKSEHRVKMPTVVLSDEKQCEVRTLGIYELDAIERTDPGLFTYPVEMVGGKIKQVEWDISKYEETGKEPPQKPDTPEHLIEEETEEWYMLRDYTRYQAALLHRKESNEIVAQYYEKVLGYILANCIDPEDIPRIVIDEDLDKIYAAATVPQVTMSMLAKALRQTFNASFDDQEIFEAMDRATGGSGAYNQLRKWEMDWANKFGLSDVEIALVPVEERARRICAMMLDRWFEFLELDKIHKKNAADALSQ